MKKLYIPLLVSLGLICLFYCNDKVYAEEYSPENDSTIEIIEEEGNNSGLDENDNTPTENIDNPVLSEWNSEHTMYYVNGNPATGFTEIDGDTYYFDSEGYIQYGMIQIENDSYYLDSTTGILCIGTFYIDNITYTTDESGKIIDESTNSVEYSCHVQNIGWQEYQSDGDIAGTTGQSLRLEAITIYLDTDIEGSIEYRTHIQNIGWESSWVTDGDASGTSGQSLRLEGIQIRLTGAISEIYDIYYRVHAQNFGWLDWACNGERAGTQGYSYRLEGIQIVLNKKGQEFKEATDRTFVSSTNLKQEYTEKYVSDDELLLDIDETRNLVVSSEYDYWGEAKEVSAISSKSNIIKIDESKDISDDSWHKVETKTYFITGVSNGHDVLTIYYADGTTKTVDITVLDKDAVIIEYSAHVQNIGWQDSVYSNSDDFAGTSGQSLRLEAVKCNISEGDIYYRTHIQDIGWESTWSTNGQVSGTSGLGLRLEAIQIQLSDELAENYDVYYRVHAENFGWLDWACNGERSGTQGFSYRLEGLQIVLIKKGDATPENTSRTFVKSTGGYVDNSAQYVSSNRIYLEAGESATVSILSEYDYWNADINRMETTIVNNGNILVSQSQSQVDENWHCCETVEFEIQALETGTSYINVSFADGTSQTIEINVIVYDKIVNGNTIQYTYNGKVMAQWTKQNNAYYLDYVEPGLYTSLQLERVSVDGFLDTIWYQVAYDWTKVPMPNCFTYAMARISEIIGKVQVLDGATRVNYAGELWYNHDSSFTQSSTPVKGALIIWQAGGIGHVAVVEDVFEDGTIAWSQSNYGGSIFEYVIGDPSNYAYMTLSGYLISDSLPDYSGYTSIFNSDNCPIL